MDERAGVVGEVRDDRNQPIDFGPPIVEMHEEDRHVVIRIRVHIAPCAGTEQNHALDAIATKGSQRRSKAG